MSLKMTQRILMRTSLCTWDPETSHFFPQMANFPGTDWHGSIVRTHAQYPSGKYFRQIKLPLVGKHWQVKYQGQITGKDQNCCSFNRFGKCWHWGQGAAEECRNLKASFSLSRWDVGPSILFFFFTWSMNMCTEKKDGFQKISSSQCSQSQIKQCCQPRQPVLSLNNDMINSNVSFIGSKREKILIANKFSSPLKKTYLWILIFSTVFAHLIFQRETLMHLHMKRR